MVGVQEAAVRAAGLVHEGISTGEWAGLMAQFNTVVSGRDPVIGRAASLRNVLAIGSRRGSAPFEVELAGGELTPGEHRLVRLAALQATRAAVKGAGDVERLLLSGVERDLLEVSARGGPVGSAFRGWGAAVTSAAGSMSPETALRVAWTQRTLLRLGVGLLDRHELVDGVGHERLRDAVVACSAAWDRAHATWRDMAPRQPAPMDALARATVALQLAVRDASEQEVLQQLVRTGFGGNLVGALAVTPPGFRRSSELVRTAMDLEPKSDVAASFRPLATSDSTGEALGVADRAVPTATAAAGTEPVVSVIQRQPRSERGLDLDPVELADKAGIEELARMRDAGVLAGAARAGVAEARRAVGDASDAELGQLVELGARARAALVEAALPVVRYWSKRFFEPARSEFVQTAAMRLMTAAALWDPNKSLWSTYTYAATRYEFLGERARRASRREFASETLDEQRLRDPQSEQVFGSVADSPEDVLVAAAERQHLQQILSLVPPGLREAVVARLGHRGGDTPPMVEVAASLGLKPGAARNRVGKGFEVLRELVAGDEASGTATLRHLAMALRSETKPAVERMREGRLPPPGQTPVTPSCA